MGNLDWYALQVRPTKEMKVHRILLLKQYECLLPLTSTLRNTISGVREVRTALFPGYLFCRLDMGKSRMPLLTTPDVFGLVGSRGIPTPLGDSDLTAIKKIVESNIRATPWAYIEPGLEVQLRAGPLNGLRGIVVKQETSTHLVVSVELLQRSISIEIRADWLCPVGVRDSRPVVSTITA